MDFFYGFRELPFFWKERFPPLQEEKKERRGRELTKQTRGRQKKRVEPIKSRFQCEGERERKREERSLAPELGLGWGGEQTNILDQPAGTWRRKERGREGGRRKGKKEEEEEEEEEEEMAINMTAFSLSLCSALFQSTSRGSYQPVASAAAVAGANQTVLHSTLPICPTEGGGSSVPATTRWQKGFSSSRKKRNCSDAILYSYT